MIGEEKNVSHTLQGDKGEKTVRERERARARERGSERERRF